MTISDWIALLAATIGLLAALYARWVWSEARKTNLLALHANRLEVFRAFNSLRQAVQERGASVEEQRVAMFHNPCQEAKFYSASEDVPIAYPVFRRLLGVGADSPEARLRRL